MRFDNFGAFLDTRRTTNPQLNYEVKNPRGKDHKYSHKKLNGNGYLGSVIHKDLEEIPGFSKSNKLLRKSLISRKHEFNFNNNHESKVFSGYPRKNNYNPLTNKLKNWRRYSQRHWEGNDILNQNKEKKITQKIQKNERNEMDTENRFGKFYSNEKEKMNKRKLNRRHQSMDFKPRDDRFKIPKAEKLQKPVESFLKVKIKF